MLCQRVFAFLAAVSCCFMNSSVDEAALSLACCSLAAFLAAAALALASRFACALSFFS